MGRDNLKFKILDQVLIKLCRKLFNRELLRHQILIKFSRLPIKMKVNKILILINQDRVIKLAIVVNIKNQTLS